MTIDRNTLGTLCELTIEKLEAFTLDSQGNKVYLGDGQELSGLAGRINDAAGKTVVDVRRPSILKDLSSTIIVNGPFGKTTVGYTESFSDGSVLVSEAKMDQYRLRCIDFLKDWIAESKLNPIYALTFDTDAPTSQLPPEFGYELAAIDDQFLWSMKSSLDEIDISCYTKPRSPSEWERLSEYTWKTIKRRIDDGSVRAIKPEGSRDYRIHIEDLSKARISDTNGQR